LAVSGLSIGKFNVNTNVGDGIAINALIGKYNLNTRVGHGVNVAVMKGDYNVNVRYGDGMNIALAANVSDNIGPTYGKCNHAAFVLST
jgi:hypothetical protein